MLFFPILISSVRYHNKLIAPATTLLVSLTALNAANWDVVGYCLWGLACMASVINIHSTSTFVTRASVSHGTGRTPDFRNFPRVLDARRGIAVSGGRSVVEQFVPMPEKYYIETYGYPFSARKITSFSTREIARIKDESFYPRFVTSEDVLLNCSSDRKGFRRIAIEIPTIMRCLLYIDQVRHLDYMNQFLAFCSSSSVAAASNTKMSSANTAAPYAPVAASTAQTSSPEVRKNAELDAAIAAIYNAKATAMASSSKLSPNTIIRDNDAAVAASAAYVSPDAAAAKAAADKAAAAAAASLAQLQRSNRKSKK